MWLLVGRPDGAERYALRAMARVAGHLSGLLSRPRRATEEL
jgi:hypothetical protein